MSPENDEAERPRDPGTNPGEDQPAAGAGRGERPGRSSSERLLFERIVPELLKRGLEAGRGTSMPREIATYVVSQLNDAREGVVNVVGQEVGRFLRQADIASEVRKVLTGLEIEAHVRLSFRRAKPDADEARHGTKPEKD